MPTTNNCFVLSMYLNDRPQRAAGRALRGVAKKLGNPGLRVRRPPLVGTVAYGYLNPPCQRK